MASNNGLGKPLTLRQELEQIARLYGRDPNSVQALLDDDKALAKQTERQYDERMEKRRKTKETEPEPEAGTIGTGSSDRSRENSSMPTPTSTTTPGSEQHECDVVIEDTSRSDWALPEWYSKLLRSAAKSREIKELDKAKGELRVTITALRSFKDCLLRAKDVPQPDPKLQNELRKHLHKAEFLRDISEAVLVKLHMLDNGLNHLSTSKFDWDIRADGLQLWRRWSSRDFDLKLLRGLIAGGKSGKAEAGIQATKRNTDRIDPRWRALHPSDARFRGQGGFVNGQWWPTQLSCVRDGVHGAAQGGIFGGKRGEGAFSIVLSGGNHYGDVDQGEEIHYSGTDGTSTDGTGTNGTPSENTRRLIESCDTVKQPVRVIRSWNQDQKNQYRPERGFRYDGLYMVVGYKLSDPQKGNYIFHLERIPGQDPIRYKKGEPSTRPTPFEVSRYDDEVAISKFKRGDVGSRNVGSKGSEATTSGT